jgi:osmotically-inducible protein OsmY
MLPGIDIVATQGIVELSGKVETTLVKMRAVSVAQAARGVRSVVDRLDLQFPALSDEAIISGVSSALSNSAVMAVYPVEVRCAGGAVTLRGQVRSWYARQLAGWLAEGVPGTRLVDNRISVDTKSARGDQELAADIASRLRWSPRLDSTHVQVAARAGAIYLRGTVANDAQRQRVVSAAWVAGVSRVDDGALVVRRVEADVIKGPAFAPSEFEVARTVRDAIAYDPRISAADVHPLVSGGFVLLRGTVRSNVAKLAAEAAARNTIGARGVTNQLKVLPSPGWSDADTQARAQLALRQDVYTRDLPISVSVTASRATIDGRARTAFERGHATQLIASIEGVRDVDNQIVVSDTSAVHLLNGRRGDSESLREGAGQRGGDPDIPGAIRRRLLHSVLGAEVSAEVDRGVATLNGIVQTTSERVSATLCAYEAGALFVDNRILVRGLD